MGAAVTQEISTKKAGIPEECLQIVQQISR
jgi:hypothetical protein